MDPLHVRLGHHLEDMVRLGHDGGRAVRLGHEGRAFAVVERGQAGQLVAADRVHHKDGGPLEAGDEEAPELLGLGAVVVEVDVLEGAGLQVLVARHSLELEQREGNYSTAQDQCCEIKNLVQSRIRI